jgi:signal transduction histidine kinase
MLDRMHRSLALRLALVYGGLFAVGAAAVFAVLYWLLAQALETRDRAAVEQRLQEFADLYENAGPAAIRSRLAAEQNTPEVSSLLVRIIGAGGDTVFARVPNGWIEQQAQGILVPDGWGGWEHQVVRTVRVPRDAEKDFTVASRQLSDGRLLQVARSTDNRTVLLAPLRRSFLLVGGGALLLAAGAGSVLAWRVTRPIRLVNETARKIIATGDLAARVPSPPGGGGELDELVHQLNALLAHNASLIGAMRETLDNLAHDLRTPLARLRGTADLALQPNVDPASAREALADCVEESERVLRLLETMLDVSAAETGTLPLRRESVDLRAMVADAADLYREVAEDKTIALEIDSPSAVMIDGDPLRLGQAIANLVDNALKYTPAGGRVRLVTRSDVNDAVLEVNDTGPGVPVDEREKIWRRLYRGDASRSQRGLGLGLSLVKAIVEAHHGTITVDDAPGGGSRFTLRIPSRSATASDGAV